MGSQFSDSLISLDVQQQIDACCQSFERAWRDGAAPKMEDFINRVNPVGRRPLLRDLAILELHYRRDAQGVPLSDARICEFHPDLMPEITILLKELREAEPGKPNCIDATDNRHEIVEIQTPTVDHHPRSSRSRGLHIRCPHCSNAVELVADTPLENITCRTCGSTFSLVGTEEQTREAPTLKRIGRFELISRLGLGSFGTVWKARDTELDRAVAIKIPRKGQLPREEVEQFFREARAVAQLRHPNIVPVHEVGRDGDTIFIISDLIRGVSLGDWLSGATPSARETAELLATVAVALHHAHEKGVIHRDLKPSNILMDDEGQPHVMDFGLAKRESGEITMTVDGHVLGTPAYMSPEQAAGHGHWTDRRTDVYSLGVILFRMLTGELPFRGNHQMQIHHRLTADAPDPRKLNRHVPRDLCTICLKCLEREPTRRHATAKELADELRRYIRHEPILSRPVSRVERILRWAKREPALATAATLTMVLAVVGWTTAVVYHRQGQLLSEKVNLITQHTINKQNDSAEIAKLQSALDLWEGRANPWQFWPPVPTKQPRKMLMQRLAEQESRLATIRQQTSDVEQQVYCYLAVAIMNDVLDRNDEAVHNYRKAHDLLAELTSKAPAEVRYLVALADCRAQLARLVETKDRTDAGRLVEERRALLNRLAAEQENSLLVAEAFESELDMAFFRGFENSQDNLQRAKQLMSVFDRELNSDPEALYRLVCLLGGREPLLITRVTDEVKQD